MRIAVIGLGVVGQAQVAMAGRAGMGVIGYDRASEAPYPAAEIAACDAAVIAVGTPAARDGSADLTALYAALAGLPGHVPVIIRSTVPPGTTDTISLRIRPAVHWPEFLHERPGGAWAQSADVPFAIAGGEPEARARVVPLIAALHGSTVHECDALTAELAKYAANIHWAARVTLVNELAGITAACGGDWEKVAEAWRQDPRVGSGYTYMDGFPAGFGGACWPKDLAALTAAARRLGYRARFLEDIAAANARFREERS